MWEKKLPKIAAISVTIILFVDHPLRIWDLTILCLHSFHQSRCDLFFISLVVKDLS